MKSDEQRKQLDSDPVAQQGLPATAKKDNELEGVIESYEMAFRMQSAVPGVLDIKSESDAVKQAYGLDNNATRDFGTQCLLARRLSEAGVRFIEISNGGWTITTTCGSECRRTRGVSISRSPRCSRTSSSATSLKIRSSFGRRVRPHHHR